MNKLIAGILCLALSGLVQADQEGMKMQITSDAFVHNAAIPAKFTCEGQNVSPQLSWTGIPSAAKSLALVVDELARPLGVVSFHANDLLHLEADSA